MLEVNNLVTPSPEQFKVAIKGMRNAFKSWNKSDSTFCEGQGHGYCGISDCPFWDYGNDGRDARCGKPKVEIGRITLGENDKKLLLNLCKAGDPSHRKVLRQLPVTMEITAPFYWFKQLDTYKIGTTANSESTMHRMTNDEFTLDNFSTEGLDEFFGANDRTGKELLEFIVIPYLNSLRDKYNETKDKRYWNGINKLLPQSYMQTRTWSANYEVLLNIINQRSSHKLGEWHQLIDYWLENVPYLKEINEVVNG